MRLHPSGYCLAAIMDAYRAESAVNSVVTPSGIWDHICMAAIIERGAFGRLFEWDTRKADRNRIGTIIELLEAGLVPGLSLVRNTKGRPVVVEATS